jgi:4'-phosphopantetheinyl transferase
MITVYAISMDEEVDVMNICNNLIFSSKMKKNRIYRFRDFEDKKRMLIGEVLLQYMVYEETGSSSHICEHIVIDSLGKPHIREDSFYLNIAHSGKWIVGVKHHLPVGIDIELKKKIGSVSFVKEYFAYDEYMEVISAPVNLMDNVFYKLWTMKESYTKLIGKGLLIPLQSFIVSAGLTKLLQPYGEMTSTSYFQEYSLDENYILMVCGMVRDFDANISYLSVDHMLCNLNEK